ncbi:hypothetical protein [Nostoc sp. JL33]|uniref:hypothetical protein n=1 Tax=Nostoc sp. JL33 TaxID=2815396 RepID=UPI0025D5E4E8|nr:hypothetical protein [Nostoc sp. JL33]MBN3869695.1 hypothetical protein [Nostoc sp. JL33]
MLSSPVLVGEFKIQSGDRYKPEVKNCFNPCIPLLSTLRAIGVEADSTILAAIALFTPTMPVFG